jgi:hypothetical protein
MIDHISVAVSFSFHIYSSFFSQFSNESTLNSSKNNKKKDSTHANNLIYTETSVDENFTFYFQDHKTQLYSLANYFDIALAIALAITLIKRG